MHADELEDDESYWVKWGDRWRIAQWYAGYWWFTGTEVPKERDEIHEYEGPIKRE